MQSHHRAVLAISAAAGLALALAGLYAGSNPDTFGHLAQGRQILELGHVPELDTFSLLEPARRFVNYEWLSDLLYALCDRQFGYDGLLALKLVALFTTGSLLAFLGGALAGVPGCAFTALAIVAGIPALRMRLSDRPHVLGIALAALTLCLLDRIARLPASRVRCSIALLLTQIAWVNLHGSHLLGTLMVGAYVVAAGAEARKTFALLLAGHALAATLSPYGPSIVTSALAHVFDPRYRALISEWQPWKEADPPWLQIGPALHGAALAVLAPRLLRPSVAARPLALIALALAITSFRSMRFVAEFILLTAPLLGAGLAQLCEAHSLRVAGLSCPLVLTGAVWGASLLPPYVGIGHGASYRDLPHGAGTWLATHRPRARVFAAMDDSWFLMSELAHGRFMVDGRATFYGPDYLADTLRALQEAPEMLRRLDAEKIDAAILRFTSAEVAPLVEAMEHNASFARVLIENDHVLYVRRTSADAQPLRALTPGYELASLAAKADGLAPAEAVDLATLRRYPNTSAFVAFTEAVGELRPLLRHGAHDGLNTPATPAEWARLLRANNALKQARSGAPNVPSVAALAALVAAVACDLPAADEALEAARAADESRETLFAAQEIALRRGDLSAVQAFIGAAERSPRATDDVWLEALRRGLRSRPGCPQ